MGLQQFFEGQFGPTPQIDLDLQIARTRIPDEVELDFAELAEGLRRNNVGVGGFRLTVQARCEDGYLVLEPSEQAFVLSGDAFEGSAWVMLTITDWDGEAQARLEQASFE